MIIVFLFGIIVWQAGDFTITGRTITSDFLDSEIVSQTYELSDFDKIKILGKGNLFLKQGKDYSVKVEVQENILDD